MKKFVAIAVFAFVMLGVAGAEKVVVKKNFNDPPTPLCDPTKQKCS